VNLLRDSKGTSMNHRRGQAPPRPPVGLASAVYSTAEPGQVLQGFGRTYIESIAEADLHPQGVFFLPGHVREIVAGISGLLIAGVEWGGAGPHAPLHGGRYLDSRSPLPHVQRFLADLIDACLAAPVPRPVLGICYGAEVLAAYFGSKLHRVTGHMPDRPGLKVRRLQVEQDARFLPPGQEIEMPCFHGWGVRTLGPGLVPEAYALDEGGRREGVEAFRLESDHQVACGVNGHPDRLKGHYIFRQFGRYCWHAAERLGMTSPIATPPPTSYGRTN